MSDFMRLERELFLYVVFGTLTTVVNLVAYFILEAIGVNYIISNILAWFISVLFAYITNRRWVFESKSPDILKEMSLFFGGRIFSGTLDTVLLYVFIDILTLGNTFSKIAVEIIITILNYIFSKLIFRK